MMKKLGIVVMAGLFTVSVAGLSVADEKKAGTAPASTTAPTLPDVGKEVKGEVKAIKKKATTMKEETTTAVTAPIVAPVVAPTPTLPDVGKEVKGEVKAIKKKATTMKEETTKAVLPPILAPAPTPEKK